MVVRDFNVARACRSGGPCEADAPLAVDGDRILPLAVAGQRVQPVRWQGAEIGEAFSRFKDAQAFFRLWPEGFPFSVPFPGGEAFRVLVAVINDHVPSI